MKITEIPCKTCITRSICGNIHDDIKWSYGYSANFTRCILKKCYILRTWLKRYGQENSYNEFLKFYTMKTTHHYDKIKAHQVKHILSTILKRGVVKKVLLKNRKILYVHEVK